jgi:hypothetical protein
MGVQLLSRVELMLWVRGVTQTLRVSHKTLNFAIGSGLVNVFAT